MSSNAILLGGITFRDFEVPERVEISGGQSLAIHQLIGGGRVVDALGEDTGRIRFSGAFSGSDAAIRAQVLDAATASGTQVPLFWDSFFYTVIIEEFSVNYEKPWWIPFSVVCAIVIDPANAVAGAAASVANLIGGDIASALSLAPQAGVSLGLLGVVGAASLATARDVTSAAFSATDSSFASMSADLNASQDPARGTAAVTSLVASSGTLAALSNIKGYIERASTNMANQML